MKVGITTFGCDSGKSGAGQYLIHLLRAFSSMESEVDFEVLVYEDEKEVFVSNPNRMPPVCVGDGIRNPVLNVAWHQAALPGWCRRRGYDVLFLSAGNRRVPVSAPCPTVGTVYDFASLHIKGKYDPARMFYNAQVLPFLIRRLTRVVTISESSKRDIVTYAGVPEDRVSVIPLAADSRLYYPRDKEAAAARIRSRYGLRSSYILYIARIEHPGKNHVRLIRAFERLKALGQTDHQLVLAGSDWGRAEEVHRVAEASRYSADILFTGFVPNGDLPDLYCGSDLFVFPSLYEGFGLPILEAMCCGIPVACSNTSSMPEVAGDAALLFDPNQEEEIEEVLGRLLTDSELRDRYTQRGLARSKAFNWSTTAARTLDVIRAAAESRPRMAVASNGVVRGSGSGPDRPQVAHPHSLGFPGRRRPRTNRVRFDEIYPGEEPDSTVLLGLPFHDLTMAEALRACARTIRARRPSYFATANLDFATQAYRDPDLHRILARAERVLCDGMPLVWISGLLGAPLRERVAGSDLVPKLLDLCACRDWKVYFFGSDDVSLQQVRDILERRLPNLQVVGCHAPPVGQIQDWDNARIVADIRAVEPDVLLVALGCPKQEKWIAAYHEQTGVPLSMGIGASLDFICGKQKRAPVWMQKTGLEWSYRLITNPRRLMRRYWEDFLFFVDLTRRQLQALRSMRADLQG